eukprot:1141358-Pelagomonas_calceolata.AAC.3
MEEVAADIAAGSVGESRASLPLEEESMDPTATAPSQERGGGMEAGGKGLRRKGACCSCCSKPGGQR